MGLDLLAQYWWVAFAGYGVAFAGIVAITCAGTIRDAKRNGTSFDGTPNGENRGSAVSGTARIEPDDDGDDDTRANLARAIHRSALTGPVQRPRYRHRVNGDGVVRDPVRPDSASVA